VPAIIEIAFDVLGIKKLTEIAQKSSPERIVPN